MAAASKKRTSRPPLPDLPDELIEDILARLPARAVLRCRSLSCAWATALSSDAFVERHLVLSNRGDALRLFFSPPSESRALTIFPWPPQAHPGGGRIAPLVAAPHNVGGDWLVALTHPCRGLVLLRSREQYGRYYVCNPSIGQITALPERHPWWRDRPGPAAVFTAHGLGHDPLTKEYKVVLLSCFGGVVYTVEVYAMDRAEHWRPPAVGTKMRGPLRLKCGQGVFASGRVHWLTDRRPSGEAILSFSVGDETFGFVAPPPGIDPDMFHLTELGGCLCLYSREVPWPWHETCHYDIWMLRDSEACVWELHCRISLTQSAPDDVVQLMRGGFAPFAIVGEGRRVLFVSEGPRALLYSPTSGAVEHLFAGRDMWHGQSRLDLYEESLVSPGGRTMVSSSARPSD